MRRTYSAIKRVLARAVELAKDLVNVSEKLTFWVNVFRDECGKISAGSSCPSKELADDVANKNRLGPARKVEIEI